MNKLLFYLPFIMCTFHGQEPGWMRKAGDWFIRKMDERVEKNLPKREMLKYFEVDQSLKKASIQEQVDNIFDKLLRAYREEKIKKVHIFAGTPSIYKSTYLQKKVKDVLHPLRISYVIEDMRLGNNDITIQATVEFNPRAKL